MKFIFLFILFFNLSLINGARLALLVGIGEYDTERTGWEKLNGDKDINLLVENLQKVGFNKENIKTLKNSQATKKAVLKELKELESKVKEGDVIIFHFSGHGQPVTDLNGDEENGRDEALVPYDAFRSAKYKFGDSFYQGENHIIDDELFPIFNEVKKKVGKTGYFLVTIDACFSRGIEMDALGNLTSVEQERVAGVRGTDQVLKVNGNSLLKKIAKPTRYGILGKMAVISACREDERNFEYKVPLSDKVYGSLTYTLCLLFRQRKSFNEIEKYFKTGEYSKDKIFVHHQHPKVIVY